MKPDEMVGGQSHNHRTGGSACEPTPSGIGGTSPSGASLDVADIRHQSVSLIHRKDYAAPSVFQPANLLREARRQKQLADVSVPAVCLLDPDGDVTRYLATTGRGRRHPGWACYHTEMWTVDVDGMEIGVVGNAVGAPFAVLVAEQIAASGGELVISIASAGQLQPLVETPYFVLITRALRDEGTSAHYLPPDHWIDVATSVVGRLTAAYASGNHVIRGGWSWTTDAPYRETEAAVTSATELGIACVEMEAAALYSYAKATNRDVICLAHITNTLLTVGDDFEKGADNGVLATLDVARTTALALR